MTLKDLLRNEFDELRSGWQIALFVLLFAAISAALVVPMAEVLKIRSVLAASAASLVATLVATFIATRFINRKPFTAVGLAINKHTMRELGIGCLAGWLMMTGIFGIEYVLGYVKVETVELSAVQAVQTFGISFVFFATAAMFEEALFRGYLFQSLVRGITFIPAALVTGLLFGLAHVGNPNASALGIVNTVLVSLLFCVAYWRTRSLWLPFGIHFAWNFSQTTLYGFPTSGVDFSRYELTKLTQFGDEWLTGATYGPEGSVLATIAIIACGAYLYFSRSLQPFEGIVTLERPEENLTVSFLERDSLKEVRRLTA
jgi:hypothetical protein